MKVSLLYFKQSGKFYSDGNYESQYNQAWEIFDEVESMLNSRTLPGLINGHSLFYVYVDIPELYPGLIVPDEWKQ